MLVIRTFFIVMPTLTRMLVSLAAMVASSLAATAGATTICRWVDDKGRVHISETVPEAYKKSAICTDSREYEVSPQRQREAQQRAAKENAASQQPPSGVTQERAPAPPASASAAAQPIAKRPAQQVTDATDCETWWRLYDESAECFGPYRTTRGGIKPEAFEVCNVVPSPELKCGPRRY